MRTITPQLAAAQLVRSPRHTVSVTFQARGQGPYDDAVFWRSVQTGSINAALVALAGPLSGGSALLFKSNRTSVQQYVIAAADQQASWTVLPSPTTLLSGVSINTMDATNARGIIRLFYGNTSGLHYIESNNGGASWGSPVTITSAHEPTHDLNATYDGTTWRLGYSTGTLQSPSATWRPGTDHPGRWQIMALTGATPAISRMTGTLSCVERQLWEIAS